MALLWFVIGLGVTLAVVAVRVPSTRIPVPRSILEPTSLLSMVGGLAFRWIAILRLGRFFTVDVAIHSDHAVADSGRRQG
jgi:protein-S-isoprenylcysteine O-methyltransferase Ste14